MKPPVAYEQWREQAAVVPAALHSDQRAWAVLRHDAVHEALEHPGISINAQHPGYPKVRDGVTSRANDTMLPHLNAPTHGKFRRMMAGQFTLRPLSPQPLSPGAGRTRAWARTSRAEFHLAFENLLTRIPMMHCHRRGPRLCRCGTAASFKAFADS